MKVKVKIAGFDKTESGRPKVWQTDGVVTYACSYEPCYFVREKATKHNDYRPYSGYFAVSDCEVIK